MKDYKLLYFSFFISLFLFSCIDTGKQNSLLPEKDEKVIFTMASSYFKSLPEIDWKDYNQKDKNRILLGKKLFYDKKLSQNQTQNCASCHDMNKSAQDNLRVSPGDGGELGLRNVPSILNAHLQYAQFWDAREKDVEAQAAGPIFGEVEMGMTDTLELLSRIANDPKYPKLFSNSFEVSDSLISLENIKRAIGAFERTLLSPSRFDDYLKGDKSALSAKEKYGIKSFIDQGCIPCHSGVLLGGNMAQKFAVFGYYWDYTDSPHLDKGIYDKTMNPSDKFVFKVPTLRNITDTHPYFHDGSVADLKESIRIMSVAELNLVMEEEHVDNIAEFFKSLSGKVPDYALENKTFPFED